MVWLSLHRPLLVGLDPCLRLVPVPGSHGMLHPGGLCEREAIETDQALAEALHTDRAYPFAFIDDNLGRSRSLFALEFTIAGIGPN